MSEETFDNWATPPAGILPIARNGRYALIPSATSQVERSSNKTDFEMAGPGPKLLALFPEPMHVSWPTFRFYRPDYSSNSRPTHETSYGLAYVNQQGRIGFRLKPFAFPIGTTIVREKLWTLNANPDRLVVMIKHERDFNPKANGWEFLTVSGDGLRVLKREKNGPCLKCHTGASANDFVFPEDGRYR